MSFYLTFLSHSGERFATEFAGWITIVSSTLQNRTELFDIFPPHSVPSTTLQTSRLRYRYRTEGAHTRPSTADQNPPPPDLGAVVAGAVPGVDGADPGVGVAGVDDAVVTGVPDGLSTHQVPKVSLTPWPLVVPDPVSASKVYKGQPP